MDKLQKFDYMQGIEDKLQQLEVYELFQDLLKQLIVERPEKPLEYLLGKLQQNPVRRVFFLGPPGCARLENAGALAEYFQWKFISTGDALRNEVEKKTKEGERIEKCLKSFQYVDDEIVIDIINKEIQEAEKAGVSWIVEGFPRTRVQALALQKLGIVPDKFVHLSINEGVSLARIRQNCAEVDQQLYGQELEQVAKSLYREWDVHQREVNSTYEQFIYYYDCNDKQQQDVANDLARMLRIRFRNGAPRRPPKVLLLGPPGSGRTTQAEIIAHRFGLVCVSPESLVRADQETNPGIKLRVQEALKNGQEIPDDLVLRQVDARLKQSDCQCNGWVLDGFPQSQAQIQLFRASKIQPTLVCVFDQTAEESLRRLGNRRVDPHSGALFNLEVAQAKTEEQAARLEALPQDDESVVRKRMEIWQEMINTIEEEFKSNLLTISADRLMDQVSDQIADAIQNPVF